MKTAAQLRSALLACALLVTLGVSGWTWWRAQHPDQFPLVRASEARMPVQRMNAIAHGADLPARELSATPATSAADAVVDLFAPVSWEPPPSPQPPAPAAPLVQTPQAPPLPFEFFGRTEVVERPGAMLVHLSRGKEVFSVREQEQIDEQYRIEKIGHDALEFVYLPLGTKQILVIGSR